MKIKTISRVEKQYVKEISSDKVKVMKNIDPALHPFERAREYTRALNSVKLDKIFAKPFVGALDGHCDGVSSIGTSKNSLVKFISGACDGEIRVWDLPSKTCVWSCYGHGGFVRGIATAPDGESFFTCSDDKTVKHWKLQVNDSEEAPEAMMTYNGKDPFTGMDHHWEDNVFATSGNVVSLWDHSRSEPTQTFSWGSDTISSVKFNPAEANLLASTGSDRNICLYDVRLSSSMRKVILGMRSNALAWNPMEPFNFTAANEDGNLYTFDMRNLEKAKLIHKDHVSAVMDIAYSPTGREFVSGSYDRTVRIFSSESPKSREVYHTKRMQRVFSVQFTADAKFVLSGSDDTNIRIWKANASKQLGTLNPRAKRKMAYSDALKKRYVHLPEIKRIARHRHVPKSIKKAQSAEYDAANRQRKKQQNRIKHAKPGTISTKNLKEKVVLKELE